MSYRVRFTTQTGATGYWDGTFATHTGASMYAEALADVIGYTYTVEQVPEPGSMAAHHVEILRARVKDLEVELATVMANLAKATSVPVGADAPGEGGDSDRRRLAVLNDWIRGGHRAFGCQNGIVVALDGLCLRPVVEAPTLAALADKLAEMEAKP